MTTTGDPAMGSRSVVGKYPIRVALDDARNGRQQTFAD
ncbi:hypothetical protein ACVIHI_008396 [Bradyrhizobium sp. USDA 4524]|nr:hypothetical protein [Bradyrhizobium sp. USDA 4538]MCP1899245.1 hypothetical protein [Bradyrhizobium sp. USDA 4537]MCP1986643.1 hypothetical protein [Bradyrhizobium sp. USDA 4539]